MASQKEIVNYYFKRKADSDLLFECRFGKVLTLLKKVESNEETRASEDFANQLLKQSQSRVYKYQCAKWVPGTSNRIERFFSEAKYFLGDYRSAILPKNLESQLFLHINKNFWSPVIVQKMMNSAE